MGAAETAGTLERKWASKTERRGGGKDFFRDGSVRGGGAEAPGPAARPGNVRGAIARRNLLGTSCSTPMSNAPETTTSTTVAWHLRGVARRTALTYLIAAALWIALSDRAVMLLTSDPQVIEWLSISKGWLFVLVTAALLYFALRKQLFRSATEAEARQRAAEALATVEARQRLFIEHAPAALAMFDRQMRYIAVSRRWLADYQLSGRNVIGESHYEVLPEIPEPVKEIHRRCLAGEVLSAKADPFTRADGRVQWLRWESRPWMDAKGAIGGIVIFSEDITERIMAEARLRESEAKLREMAEAINEVFWLTDPMKSRMLYVSPAYERIWGEPSASLYSNPNAWLDSVHPEDHERIAAAVAAKQTNGDYDETYRIVRSGSEVRWIHDRAYPVRDANGTVVRIVGVAEDITEKKRMEAQFLRTQRLEAVGALADGVAHDLNNILTPILMATGILKDEANGPENLSLLTMIERSARRGADIVQQLLTFSRGVEGERIVLQPRHLIRETATLVRATFPKTIELDVQADEELWTVEANSTQLHQVLINLCVNARDAMSEGGRLTLMARNVQLPDPGHPQCSGLKPGPYVCLGVVDTGEGMTPETQSRLFEPFFTTKAPGKGTGLGLSTVLGIVRSHGGHVSVYSERGHGSRFMVYLPALPGVREFKETVASPQAGGHGELILIVDDEPTIREATRALLLKNGYAVLTVGEGDAALALASQHADTLRVVLTDVFMPAMDGVALTRALRTIVPAVAVIATSGLDKPEKRRELEEAGVCEFLGKPCASDDLLAAIRRMLGKKV